MMNIRRLHPGFYIRESLEAMEMSSREFSIRTGISERTLSAVINGKGSITFDIAYKLSVFFDNSINYWINLQSQYDLYIRESEKEIEMNADWQLIKPIKQYLLSCGYISKEDDKLTIVNKCRSIAGVNSLSLLNRRDPFTCFKEQAEPMNNDYFCQNFWIALALNEARKKNSSSYNKQKLIDSIGDIRKLTTQKPSDFYPELVNIFNDCGISFVLLPYLYKSGIYGATKWFSKNNVMLAVSNRGGKADSFWFTLFHEISHILMEHRREMLVSVEDDNDIEANIMAADMLIPRDKWEFFVNSNCFTIDTIRSFADMVGVLPCIVLGRLHKEMRVSYGKFDRELNVSYKVVLD